MSIATETTRQNTRGLRQACLCAKICDDFRGHETRVLDLRGVTPIFDYFVLTSAGSRRQMMAIAEEVDKLLKSEGSKRFGTEGHEGGGWILHDFGDLVLHVFSPESRELYDLESLWADAQAVDWREVLNLPPRTEEPSGNESFSLADEVELSGGDFSEEE